MIVLAHKSRNPDVDAALLGGTPFSPIPPCGRGIKLTLALHPALVTLLLNERSLPPLAARVFAALRACGILVEEEPFDEPDEAFRTKSVHLYVGKLGQRGP